MPRAEKITKTCLNCNHDFKIPPCRDWREHCCSSSCKEQLSKKKMAESLKARTRTCQYCSADFVARQTQIDAGVGKFCSAICGIKANYEILNSPTNKEKRTAAMIDSHKSGKVKYKYGPENPTWKGGKKATYLRQKPKSAERTRNYRRNNPHKVREFSQRRLGRKIGRLPRGFVAKLFLLQRKRCAICKCSIEKKYHVDHVIPLALGGLHKSDNIQLLCPTCNVRKSAKDPIAFMQENGFLL